MPARWVSRLLCSDVINRAYTLWMARVELERQISLPWRFVVFGLTEPDFISMVQAPRAGIKVKHDGVPVLQVDANTATARTVARYAGDVPHVPGLPDIFLPAVRSLATHLRWLDTRTMDRESGVMKIEIAPLHIPDVKVLQVDFSGAGTLTCLPISGRNGSTRGRTLIRLESTLDVSAKPTIPFAGRVPRVRDGLERAVELFERTFTNEMFPSFLDASAEALGEYFALSQASGRMQQSINALEA